MKLSFAKLGVSILVLGVGSSLWAAPTPKASSSVPTPLSDWRSSPLIVGLEEELSRSMQKLTLPDAAPPYYGAYWLIEFHDLDLKASLGRIVQNQEDHGRRASVQLRVGDPSLDNSNFAGEGGSGFLASSDGLLMAPSDDDLLALRRVYWLASDATYRDAVELLDQKRAQRSAQVELESRPADFSKQEPESLDGPPASVLPSSAELEALIVAVSKVFADYPGVEDSSVSASARTLTRSVVSSEGVVSREPSTLIEFQLQCSAQAKDGMPLVHTVSSFGVPSEAQLSERARALASGLIETANAELASDSFGPVLFTDVAAAQIAHELLAMNLAGTPDGEELQGPFARRLGKRVLPDDFDAFDDPGLEHYRGLALAGHYLMDDEGVRAQRVSLVEKGRLSSFLMSRTPNRVIGASNGHGRSGLSGWARGMVGNLIVETRKGATRATLEKRLLAAARDQRAEFGIVIERLAERAFATGGASPPVPERAYKLYADGRRVPIRGAELGEINVRELRSLLGSGDHPNVYNYVVTWPSGLASPSSVVAPDLLFEEVELTKTKRSYRRPKLLPRPN